jgi:hypothetical protein
MMTGAATTTVDINLSRPDVRHLLKIIEQYVRMVDDPQLERICRVLRQELENQ